MNKLKKFFGNSKPKNINSHNLRQLPVLSPNSKINFLNEEKPCNKYNHEYEYVGVNDKTEREYDNVGYKINNNSRSSKISKLPAIKYSKPSHKVDNFTNQQEPELENDVFTPESNEDKYDNKEYSQVYSKDYSKEYSKEQSKKYDKKYNNLSHYSKYNNKYGTMNDLSTIDKEIKLTENKLTKLKEEQKLNGKKKKYNITQLDLINDNDNELKNIDKEEKKKDKDEDNINYNKNKYDYFNDKNIFFKFPNLHNEYEVRYLEICNLCDYYHYQNYDRKKYNYYYQKKNSFYCKYKYFLGNCYLFYPKIVNYGKRR
jgi:hypothetical protein